MFSITISMISAPASGQAGITWGIPGSWLASESYSGSEESK